MRDDDGRQSRPAKIDDYSDGGPAPLPPNVEVDRWVEERPVIRYRDLTEEQKRDMVWTLSKIGASLGVHWAQIMVDGEITVPSKMKEDGGLDTGERGPTTPEERWMPTLCLAENDQTDMMQATSFGTSNPGETVEGEWMLVDFDMMVHPSEIDPEQGPGKELETDSWDYENL